MTVQEKIDSHKEQDRWHLLIIHSRSLKGTLPSAFRYSSKLSLLTIFQYPLKSAGIPASGDCQNHRLRAVG